MLLMYVSGLKDTFNIWYNGLMLKFSEKLYHLNTSLIFPYSNIL